MEACPIIVLNSDTSENVVYNHPDFPAYIKKDSSQAILIFVQSAAAFIMAIPTRIQNAFFSVSCCPHGCYL